MTQLTDKAAERIKEILLEEEEPNKKVRVFVEGGGCSGFQYGFSLEEDINEDDIIVEHLGASIVIDSMSMMYLNDAVIDFVDDVYGSSFKIDNPQAVSTCGCGSSFAV